MTPRSSTPRARRDAVDRHIEQWSRELPDLDPVVEGVVTRMQRLVALLKARRHEVLARRGLQSGEYFTLHALRRRGRPYRATAGELAAEMLVSPAAMTSRLDRLEAAGQVRRVPDPADRRRVQVELTAAGHAAWHDAIEEQGRIEERLVRSLPAADRRTLDGLLRRLLLELDDEAGEDPL